MALGEQLRIHPDLTLEEVRGEIVGFDPDFIEREIDGLRRAGLPE